MIEAKRNRTEVVRFLGYNGPDLALPFIGFMVRWILRKF